MIKFEKTKNYNLKLKRCVISSASARSDTFSYTAYDKRLKYLKSLDAQFRANGYIALSPSNIVNNKRPIAELINSRINKSLPWETRDSKKELAYYRALLYTISDGKEWRTLERYQRQIEFHYRKSSKYMDLDPFSNVYLIAFDRIYRRKLINKLK